MSIATGFGFVVGGKYKVTDADGWEDTFIEGDWVTFVEDDGSIAPYFKVDDKSEVVALMLGRLDVKSARGSKPSSPRFRKQRIAPPVRVKSDVRITYNGGVGYTITNVKQIIISKDSDAAFITSIVKGIKTQVELSLSDIDNIKLKTPTSVYDFHVELCESVWLLVCDVCLCAEELTELSVFCASTFAGAISTGAADVFFSINLDSKIFKSKFWVCCSSSNRV